MQRYPALIAEAMQNKQRPDAALVPTYLVAPLQQSGALVSLDALAQREGWDEVLPPAVSQQLKVNGQWFAAPLSVHSLNWLWVNASVAEQLGVVRPPDTWSEFIALLERARKAGITGIAIGPEAWEQALIFELIASGYLGPQRFRKLFLEGDVASFSARDLAPIFLRLRQIQPYLGAATASSFGVATTLQVARGEALLQLGGNWVEGFWQHLPQPPSAALQCWRFPDTQGVVHFNTDAFVFFSSAARSSTPPHTQQRRFAALLMQSDTQSAVQQASAAPPARLDVQHTALSPCGQRSLSDMRMASTATPCCPTFSWALPNIWACNLCCRN
jgi:glucose/mannose transport system substrate-binding protein